MRRTVRARACDCGDGRFAVQLPYKRFKTEITLDALNLINLFDAKSGLFQYMSFGQYTGIQPIPTTVTATAPVTGYNITPITAVNFQRFLRDDLRSRWQIQLGARVRF